MVTAIEMQIRITTPTIIPTIEPIGMTDSETKVTSDDRKFGEMRVSVECITAETINERESMK
jgi:hypothetical protein